MIEEDLSMFSDVEDGFAVEVVWSGGGAIAGILSRPTSRAGVGTVGWDSTRTTFQVPADNVPGIATGQTLTIDGVVYPIRAIEFDSTRKLATLVLGG